VKDDPARHRTFHLSPSQQKESVLSQSVPGSLSSRLIKKFWFPATLFCGYVLAGIACRLTLSTSGNIPSVNKAIGQAAFTGLAKNVEFRSFWAAVTVAAIFAVISGAFWRRMNDRTDAGEMAAVPARSEKFSFLLLAGLILGFALLSFPSFNIIRIHLAYYDSQNFETWKYFRYLGMVPFRDFWYPYGGFYYFSLPFPPDALYAWLNKLVVFGVISTSVYILSERPRWRNLLLLMLCWWAMSLSFLVEWERYFLSMALILLFAAAVHRRGRVLFIGWGLYAGYVFFAEVAQLIYSIPSCVIILCYAYVLEKNRDDRRQLIVHGLISATIAAFSIGYYLFVLSRNGALHEFMQFYETMDSMADYATRHAKIDQWFTELSLENVLLSLTLCLTMSSLWHFFSPAKRDVRDTLPLAVSVLTLFLFQKQILRPSIVPEILGVPLLGSAVSFLLLQQHESWRRRWWAWTIPAVIVGALLIFGPHAKVIQAELMRMASLSEDIQAAFVSDEERRRAEQWFFEPSSFIIDGIPGHALRGHFLEKMSLERKDDLFVLGDDSYLYIVLDQQAPFYVTFYNQSILYSQLNSVAWLEQHKPKYVVWKSSFTQFDAVPNIVRVPLLFEKVMEKYVYADTVGAFHLLRRKRPNEAVTFDFWRRTLGATVDLGFIPSRSAPKGSEVHHPGNEGYSTFLNVMVQEPVHGKKNDILFTVDGVPYTVSFRERGNIQKYSIYLNRVWFWQLARKIHHEPLLIPQEREPGISMEVKNLMLLNDILY
jgi:hypothetical protein